MSIAERILGYLYFNYSPMAEQEIIKHLETAIAVSRDRGKKWQHKLMEILLEVAIIVFAVTISIWFHNWSESLKDRSDARQFLTGLKEDLQADITEMNNDLATYRRGLQGTHYFEQVGAGQPLSQDSMNVYNWLLFSYIHFDPRISRFEALKGSGRLNIIENKDLLLNITDLYAKSFPLITQRNDFVNSIRQSMVIPYVTQHLTLSARGAGTNWLELLRSSPMRTMLIQGESVNNNIDAYTEGIQKSELIIKEIDEELK
jgi:hypothetical protein